jgi:hypothetical protein
MPPVGVGWFDTSPALLRATFVDKIDRRTE